MNGQWRDGYVELTFGGTWPGQPGVVTAILDGWVDGDSAKGRMKVEGRAKELQLEKGMAKGNE